MDAALQIQTITGVDVEMRIAGPGGRSYAFVIDWHIRVLLVLAWYILGALLLSGSLSVTEGLDGALSSGFLFVVVIPSAALFFLYHPILEIVMQGRTPGKRIAGIRIVTQSGDVPGVSAILIRNVLRLVDSLPGVYVVGLTAAILTEQSVRIGDMAAGTLLVYEDADQKNVFSQVSGDAIARIGLDNLQLTQELIERWPELAAETRFELGCNLLKRLDVEVPADEDAVLSALHDLVRGGAR